MGYYGELDQLDDLVALGATLLAQVHIPRVVGIVAGNAVALLLSEGTQLNGDGLHV